MYVIIGIEPGANAAVWTVEQRGTSRTGTPALEQELAERLKQLVKEHRLMTFQVLWRAKQ